MEYFLSERLAPVVTTVLGQTLLLTRVDFVGKNLFQRFHPRLIFNQWIFFSSFFLSRMINRTFCIIDTSRVSFIVNSGALKFVARSIDKFYSIFHKNSKFFKRIISKGLIFSSKKINKILNLQRWSACFLKKAAKDRRINAFINGKGNFSTINKPTYERIVIIYWNKNEIDLERKIDSQEKKKKGKKRG